MNQVFDRITFNPQIMGGRACIRGMRIPVSVIVGQIAHGASFEEVLEGYPDLGKGRCPTGNEICSLVDPGISP